MYGNLTHVARRYRDLMQEIERHVFHVAHVLPCEMESTEHESRVVWHTLSGNIEVVVNNHGIQTSQTYDRGIVEASNHATSFVSKAVGLVLIALTEPTPRD